MDRTKNIVLTGMSGAGKSTLGVLLAKELNFDFLDTDLLLQQTASKKLQEILDTEGVDAFLALEERVVSGVKVQNTVISTGGSVVYSEKAMAALRENGTVVYLSASYEALQKRLTNVSTRGIVIKSGHTLEDVYRERLPLYERYSDLTLDCGEKGIEDCVAELVAKLRQS